MRVLSSPAYSKELLGNRLLFVTCRLLKYSNSSPTCLLPNAFLKYDFCSTEVVAFLTETIAKLLLGAK